MIDDNKRMTNVQIAEFVGEKVEHLEEKIDLKLDGLKWRMIAALVGGQALAGLVAGLITRTTPAEGARAAAHLFLSLL